MKISCPLCDTSIEVSKFLVGQKGRCPRCSSKFLIPESDDIKAEILEKGEIPEDEPEPVPPPKKSEPEPAAKKETAEPPKESVSSSPPKAKSVGPRKVMPATGGGAPMRTPARPVVVKQSSGAFGFMFAIVLAALVGVVVYVMMERQKVAQANAEAQKKPKEKKVITVVQQPVRQRQPEPVEPDEPEPEGFPVFAKVIQPVLEAKCVSCHGEEKKKGRLAMHNFEALAAGSGNGSILEADPDDATRIEMVFRAELPEDDDEHMPPQGKPQLTPDELAIIKWWIKEGAHEDIESTEAPDELRETMEKKVAQL